MAKAIIPRSHSRDVLSILVRRMILTAHRRSAKRGLFTREISENDQTSRRWLTPA